MSSKFTNAFVSEKREIPLDYNGEQVVFTATEMGYLSYQSLSADALSKGKNPLAALVAESISDPDGNKFTYDEIVRLKKDWASAFFEAVIDLHGLGQDEKN